LTHLDACGQARMVDVSAKAITQRVAVAEGRVRMRAETLARIVDGTLPKGDVLATARIAGIMAAKQTPSLVPLCHPLALGSVHVDLVPEADGRGVVVRARVGVEGRTGVEMEALTAVAAAALTLYDMCKAVDRGMTIEGVRLLEKRGGRSGVWKRPRGSRRR
jgi:cyclic pyranopterin phosphate synthase